MKYIDESCFVLENSRLRLTVAALGAEAVSVVDKASGAELLWQADPAVWPRHAPLCFPYTGNLTGGRFFAKGRMFEGGQHGFARDFLHTRLAQTEDTLTLELRANADTLALWPYDFVLRTTYRLEENTVHHTVTVENVTEPELCFGLGFHPGFALPFDDKHTTADYELRFEQAESPLCVDTQPTGLLNGKMYYLARNVAALGLTDSLFDEDSHCIVNLRSHRIALVEKDTGRRIECRADCPYTLLWSALAKPLRFVCIEPWYSLPGEENGPSEWENRPCAAALHPGESWSATLSTTFER